MSLRSLVELKVEVLFHDPPHKSFLIKRYGKDFGVQHEKEAKVFRNAVLNGTRFAGVAPVEALVHVCDRLSATVERKALMYIGWPKGVYLPYEYIHNIFDPSHRTPLEPPQDLGSRVSEVVNELNRVLREVDRDCLDDVALYNTLYMALEASWHVHRLPSALADTRIPTHTVFDHLYAAATMANIVKSVGSGGDVDIGGFYVLVDFPGVQKFVGAGRKAGDFWASSWLLSNVMWGVAEYFAFGYGFDVIVSPTPRLNPYATRSLFRKLSEADCIKKSDLEKLPTVEFLRELEGYSIHPLVPATVSLVLPHIIGDSPSDVLTSVKEVYANTWRSIVDDVINSFTKRSSGLAERLLHEKLKEVHDIIKVPLQGVRIFVVDIAQVYKAVLDCLSGAVDRCRDLGLEVKDGLAEFEKRLAELVCSSSNRCREFENAVRDTALTLLWHFLYTRAVELAKRFGVIATPTPRPFWMYSQGSFQPVAQASYVGNWIPCIVCGSEPAVIKFAKRPAGEGEVTFDFQRSEGIPKGISVAELEKEATSPEASLEALFKPGEALGPYCLLKRAIYIVNKASRGLPEFASTDDVAFKWKSDTVYRLIEELKEVAKRFVDAVKRSASEEEYTNVENALKSLMMFGMGKGVDVDVTAKTMSMILGVAISSERLVSTLSRVLIKLCIESESKVVPKLLDLVEDLASARDDVVEEVGRLFDLVKEFSREDIRVKGYRASEICKLLEVPITFAILRSDADYIGDLHKGLRPVEFKDYMKILREVLVATLKNYVPEDEAKSVGERFERIAEVFETLSLREVPATPARTSALSLALMLQALEDTRIVDRSRGMLIFSGGDDLLALVPAQTALRTAFELRESYAEDFVEVVVNNNSFRILRMHIPLGRSTSIRFANIKDLMNIEIARAFELLEGVAKEARWRLGPVERSKDSLVVSDSRSGEVTLLPLNSDMIGLSKVGLGVALLTATGALSSSFPEDFRSMIEDVGQIPSSALAKVFEYVLRRNVVSSEVEGKKLKDEVISVLMKWLEKARDCSGEVGRERLTLLSEVASLVAILRRHI